MVKEEMMTEVNKDQKGLPGLMGTDPIGLTLPDLDQAVQWQAIETFTGHKFTLLPSSISKRYST